MHKPKKILIHQEQHQPSMHLVGEKTEYPLKSPIEPSNFGEQKESKLKVLHTHLSETSMGTLLLYFSGILVSLTAFLFRLPTRSNNNGATQKINTTQKFDRISYKYAGASLAILITTASFYSVDYSLAQIKSDVTDHGSRGVANLISGTEYLSKGDKVRAQASFMAAEQSFDNGLNQLPSIPKWLRSFTAEIPYINTLGSANDMFELAGEVSRLSFEITSLQATEQNIDSIILTSNLLSNDQIELNAQAKSTIDRLSQIKPDSLPEQYSNLLREAQSSVLPTLNRSLSEASDINIVLNTILGAKHKQRFFIAFQNDNELRASGGFLGSFAVVDINKGQIQNLNVPSGGTYDVQGQQSANLTPPSALSLINSRWELQDANWWVDWPTSARQIEKLYESAGGSSVDGVIAFDTSVLEKFMELTGPIVLSDYNLTLTAENVIEETQYHVEVGRDLSVEKPKQIISSLTPLLIKKLEDKIKSDPLSVANVLLEALKSKHVQIYSKDQQTKIALSNLGWDGSLHNQIGADSLAIVHSNIAGQKTDAVMDDSVDYEISIDQDGIARAKLIISREHKGVKGDLFTGVRNVDYVRVYVPEGSELISAYGFTQPDGYFFDAPQNNSHTPNELIPEIQATVDSESKTLTYEELGHTVFANWLMTDPGHTSTGVLVYRLPHRFLSNQSGLTSWMDFISSSKSQPRYEFNWIQQPGLGDVSFTHKFRSEVGISSIVSSRPLQSDADGWQWTTTLNKDINLVVDIN
jgi:hypothetical protein